MRAADDATRHGDLACAPLAASEGRSRGQAAEGGSARVSLVVASVGCGALVALALLLARVQVEALASLATFPTGAVFGLLAGVVLAAFAVLARPSRSAQASPRSAVLACAACLVGSALLAAGPLAPAGSVVLHALLLAAGVGMGLGVGLLAVAWARCVSVLSPRQMTLVGSGALVVAGLAYSLSRLVASASVLASCAAVLALVSAATLAALGRGARLGLCPWEPSALQARRALGAISDGARRVEDRCAAGVRLADVAAMLWVSLCAVAFSAFITGLTWDPVVSQETAWRELSSEVWGTLAGALAAALAVLLVARGHDDASCLGLLGRAVQPVALAVVLVVPILKTADVPAPVADACSVASSAGFALITAITFVQVIFTARLAGMDVRRAVAALLVWLCAFEALGLVSIVTLGPSGRILCFVLEAAFLTAVVVYYALRARGVAGAVPDDAAPAPTAPTDAAEPSATPDEATWERLCASIAAARGLSPRETDVLGYLARGFGSAYIAPELGISENTVRTHVRHIYEKLGVSSRAGLIEFVDGWDAGK